MGEPKRKTSAMLQKECEQFNAAYPVGTEGFLKKDFVEDPFATKTRSTAQVMCGHSAVIWLENVRGCYLLDRFTPSLARSDRSTKP